MIDILTYAIARRKSAAKLDELYSQTKAVADAAKDSAETSKAAAETSKDLLNKTTAAAQQGCALPFCKLCTWPGRERPAVVFHQEKHLKGGIRNG